MNKSVMRFTIDKEEKPVENNIIFNDLFEMKNLDTHSLQILLMTFT